EGDEEEDEHGGESVGPGEQGDGGAAAAEHEGEREARPAQQADGGDVRGRRDEPGGVSGAQKEPDLQGGEALALEQVAVELRGGQSREAEEHDPSGAPERGGGDGCGVW